VLHIDNIFWEIECGLMKTFGSFLISFTLLATLCGVAISAETASLDTAQIEQLTGLRGSLNEEEGVFKVTVPRSDVPISVMAGGCLLSWLTSWAAFTKGKKAEAMVMGDLVLMQDEVNPVMSAALDAGLSVTALHNHFFYDEPKVYFMHIGGEGTTQKLAAGVKAALDKEKEVRAAAPELPKSFGKPFAPEKNAITGAGIDAVLGSKGQAKDGMFKVTIGRKATMPCGCEVATEMGVNTWAGFAGTDQDALVDGDFVMLESELQPVLKSLRKDNINIVAIHNHMTAEEPRYVFLHYWGRGLAAELPKAVKNALDETAR
jgi:Domain of Unknown Function (DUF1259)